MYFVNSKLKGRSLGKGADGNKATAAPVNDTAELAASDDGLEAAFEEALAQCEEEEVDYVRCGRDYDFEESVGEATSGDPKGETRVVEASSVVLKGRK